MLPHVDTFRPCHSLASLEELVAALGQPEDPRDRLRLMRMLEAGWRGLGLDHWPAGASSASSRSTKPSTWRAGGEQAAGGVEARAVEAAAAAPGTPARGEGGGIGRRAGAARRRRRGVHVARHRQPRRVVAAAARARGQSPEGQA